MRSAVRAVAIIFVAAVLIAGGVVVWGVVELRAAGPLNGYARLVIPRGASLTQAASQLRLAGVIRHQRLFVIAARLKGVTIKAGEFDFMNHMTAFEVMRWLAEGNTVVRRFTVPEGFTSREIVRLLENAAGFAGTISGQIAEGSLLPDTYHYSYGDNRNEIIRRMTQAMAQLLDELWPRRAAGLPLDSQNAALILASIVEKETAVAQETPPHRCRFSQSPKKGNAVAIRSDRSLCAVARRHLPAGATDPQRFAIRSPIQHLPPRWPTARANRKTLAVRRLRLYSTLWNQASSTSSPMGAAATRLRVRWPSTIAMSPNGVRSNTG